MSNALRFKAFPFVFGWANVLNFTRGLPSPVSWLGSHTKRVIAAMSATAFLSFLLHSPILNEEATYRVDSGFGCSQIT
nr:hypothetical protein [Tanacetum cinerariifolium]